MPDQEKQRTILTVGRQRGAMKSREAPSKGLGSAPSGALAAVTEVNHYEKNDDTHGRELQESLRSSLAPDDEGGYEGQGQRRVTRGPEGEVSNDQPDQRVQNSHERGQDLNESERTRVDLLRSRRPQPDLADYDKREEGRDEGYGATLEGYRLRVEAVGLVPAGLTNVVAAPGSAPASGVAGLSPQGLVRVLSPSAEAAPQALAEGGTA